MEHWNWPKVLETFTDHETAVRWAQERGLLKNGFECRVHRKPMTMRFPPSMSFGIWKCTRHGCNKSRSITDQSWFEAIKLEMHLVFRLMFAWSRLECIKEACSNATVAPATVVEYYKWCNKVIEIDFSRMPIELGGNSSTVQRINDQDPFERLFEAIKEQYQ